ncbi:malate dehydrogenase [Aliarcobacter butzleri JV22]|uniref:Malate dehydrogenase n=3 Tax=Aliarcobacter butzleri TaxID=28197 RepID=A0A837JD21_9BACT|nr:malate dehydrogenase [Aliarcobacter butzleri JV22]KLD97970.1 malate dehydrogenase [Aliarcobacter butzleri L349]KLD99060.1 malate dehydrogenase [Aliarcobacter butzleri L348]KLE05927.1 malate dehydrogenase [Aliarcobacter butzleri L352]KLE06342.1 malate dehydrogenase [Aliarcobacter butzleri L353]KLE09832.1 malate dehydrogenase [Aliarcobacter butzleri L355]KLE11080.1 malate dehydrogenase [Aliarcobacter butzleri L354]
MEFILAKSKIIVDLSKENLFFEEKNQTIKLLNFRLDNMSLDIAIYEKDKLIKNSSMVFAHLPKKLKAKLNPKK